MTPKGFVAPLNNENEYRYNDDPLINSDVVISNFQSISMDPTEDTLPLTNKPVSRFRIYFKEILATVTACLAHLSMGCALGYSSPALPDMNKPGRSLPLTVAQGAFFSSLLALGAAVGGIIAGTISDKIGRKHCNILTGIFFTAGWLLIAYSENYLTLCSGRLLTGIATGLASLNNSVYIAEIASPAIRGILCSVTYLTANIGLLLVYVLGAFIPWSLLAIVSSVFSVMLVISMCFLPETPIWLVKKNAFLEAEKSLQWLRYHNDKEEIQLLKEEMSTSVQKTISTFSIQNFTKQQFYKPLMLAFLLMFFQQFSGMITVVFNAVSIFQSAGTEDANTSAAILGVVNILGAILAVAFVDRLGRRILLLISAFLAALSMFGLGLHYYMITKSIQLNWLPVTCLLVFQFAFNFGLGTVPWVIMGEIFPEQTKALATSIITFSCYAMSFIVALTFRSFEELLKPYGVFWMFASISAIGFGVIFRIIPETKGKSLAEIQKWFTVSQ